MQTVMNKVLKVVGSCNTPQQLQVAGHFASLAKKQVNQDQWLDVAGAIQSKAGEMLSCDPEESVILRRAYFFN
jgi:hypothetical protein